MTVEVLGFLQLAVHYTDCSPTSVEYLHVRSSIGVLLTNLGE